MNTDASLHSARHAAAVSGSAETAGSAETTVRRASGRRRGLGDLAPQRPLSAILQVAHMPGLSRLAYYGLLAVTGVTLLVLLPIFLSYIATISSVMHDHVAAGILGLLALMFSFGLLLVQTALVLKLPERLEWVRTGLTLLALGTAAEAVTRGWLYPSVISMDFRWDLAITAGMVLLLWLPSSTRWLTARSDPAAGATTVGAHLAA